MPEVANGILTSPTTLYTGDQPTAGSAIIDGVTVATNATLLDGLQGEAPTYGFSALFTMVFNGQTLSFRPNVPYSIDASLLAALTAAGAPIISE
jgi:hypothetical protein